MRALSPSVYILSSNFPVFEVSSLTFLFNFVTCVLGVFDGQKRAPSVCVALNLVSGLGQNFLVNSTPGPAERLHIMGEYTYLEGINCPHD